MNTAPVLVTPTWSADLPHFRLMRESLERSPLAGLTHHLVVQTEDLPAFEAFAERPGVHLRTTAEVLPASVEARRQQARHYARMLGRHATRIGGSLRRNLGWPPWPAYTGWHTQQLCKLIVAAEHPETTTVVLDSDLIITPRAQPSDFVGENGVLCPARWQAYGALRGKVRKWIESAAALYQQPLRPETLVNHYFDTPFPLHGPTVHSLIEDLERRFGQRWWRTLVNQPPRRWSEFGTYKQYLLHRRDLAVDWRAPECARYLHDTRDVDRLVDAVARLWQDREVHYVTIQSRSAGRDRQDPNDYLVPLRERLPQLSGTRARNGLADRTPEQQ